MTSIERFQGAHRESVSKFPVFSLCFPCQPEFSLFLDFVQWELFTNKLWLFVKSFDHY